MNGGKTFNFSCEGAKLTVYFHKIEGPEYVILNEDLKFIRKVILIDSRIHKPRIIELKRKLLQSNPIMHTKTHLIAAVLDYTKHTLEVRLETDVVESSARDSEDDAHKALLTMVDRLKAGADGFIVRAVLPFGRVLYPCEMLMLEPTLPQGNR
jgi:hypothetical protein